MKNLSPLQKLFTFFAFLILYYLVGYAGLKLATINNYASPIWPAAGIAIGGTLLFGHWLSPAFFLGSFLINLPASESLIIPFCLGAAAMFQAWAGRFIIRSLLIGNFFKDYTEVFSVITSAVISSAVSASLATLTLWDFHIISSSTLQDAWYTWWSGDALGVMMVMPLILEIRKKNFSTLTTSKIAEASLTGIFMMVVLYFTFINNLNQAYLWLIAPMFILIGVRCGRINASIILLIVSCFVTILTVNGYGPFQYGNTNRNLFYVQTLITGYSFSVLFIKQMKMGIRLSNTFFAGLSILTGILFSITYLTTYYEKKNTIDDFNRMVEASMSAIDKTTDQYEIVLTGTSGAISMSNSFTHKEWKAYVDSINPTSYFKSANGLGFVAKVNKANVSSYIKKHGLDLKVIDKDFSNQYDDRFLITYIEPANKNNFALGLDLGSEVRRREGAENSLRMKRVYATDQFVFLTGNDTKGFLIFYPTFNGQNEFMGWVYAPIISHVFFSKTLAPYVETLRIRVNLKGEELYHSDKRPSIFRKDDFYHKNEVSIFGKLYTLEFYPTDLFFRRHSDYSLGIPLILNLLVLIITALSIEQLTFGHRAEVLIQERTKELDASKMQLIESSKMASLGEMASGMAHEINNPLTIIQGKIQVIQIILGDLGIKDRSLFEELGKIKTTTDRIEKIVKGLRNFSRAANQDPFEITGFKPIITETLELCAEKIRAEGINLIVSEIPPISVKCRPAQLSQVLVNLLNNSRDAIHESNSKWIELSFKIVKSDIQIIVTDSGDGIPPDIAQKMMEPFFTTKEVGKGTGLGLSISKGIIAAHGGKLWLDSANVNTRFIIELRFYT